MIWTVAGFVYGGVLIGLSVLAAGAGHGTDLPMAVSSAPSGLIGFQAAAFGAPVLWTVGGLLIGGSRRRAAMALLTAHYIGAAWLASRGPFADWAYLWRNIAPLWPLLALWTAAYVAGQLAMWRRLYRPA
jgi:hypothetical protein